MEKKLFFCGRAGAEEPGGWAQMKTEAEARDLVHLHLEKAGWPAKPVHSFYIASHPGGDEDSRFYSWGEDQPGFDGNDVGHQVGLSVEVDGKTVYDDLADLEEGEG